ncbi:MAG: hypothetical protein LGR52_11890, partial [Candidatus Thiosymbion ectosymbiont of Robbea hypermnestra]|nr:hypothetical protein [Candidatus Thiosymbion ectosymbiont of Robbea hypermnestra]
VNLENPVNPVLLADCDARADKTVTCFALVASGIRRICPGTTKLQHHPQGDAVCNPEATKHPGKLR